MDKNAPWKWLILIVLCAGSMATVLPFKDKIHYGLDLVGGTSVTVAINEEELLKKLKEDKPAEWEGKTPEELRVALDKYQEGMQERTLEVLRNRVDAFGTQETVIYPEKSDRVVVQLPGIDEVTREKAIKVIQTAAFLAFRMVHADNEKLTRQLFDKRLAPEGYEIVNIGTAPYYRRTSQKLPAGANARLLKFHAPPLYDFMLVKHMIQNKEYFSPYFVERRRQLTGEYITSAHVGYQQSGLPSVDLSFNSEGAERFGAITRDFAPGGTRNPDPNNGRLMGIVLDGTLHSAPQIKQPILTGDAQITGSFSLKEAQFLVNILKSGALPAPLKIVEQRTVDPSLGEDAIRGATSAVKWGASTVVLFMLGYYLIAGAAANIALVLNIVLLPLGMIVTAGFLGIFAKDVGGGGGPIALPVLTLPGIAGILLTIGMAVDANVLIYERMREEARAGKNLTSTIAAGFNRAFTTILDSNLTTLLTGVILFIFGSGPVRGFAVTLCAGIIVSLYTALTVTHMLFDLLCRFTPIKSMKMLSVIPHDLKIPFIETRYIAIGASWLLILVTWGIMIARGVHEPKSVLSVDFTGGSSISFTYDVTHRPAAEDVRRVLEAHDLRDLQIQFQTDIAAGGKEYMVVRVAAAAAGAEKPGQVAMRALSKEFPDAKFFKALEDDVGPQVGKELTWRATKAMILAMLGIMVYVAVRFEFGFAMGAVVATVHDVLMTIGLFSLCGRQISLPVIAALLTIVGYSVNDTIVVFDRIREDLRLMRDKDFLSICNLAINSTLSRTILTSFATLISIIYLLVFAGGEIFDFALAMTFGIVTGTYSSIYIATPIVYAYSKGKKPEMRIKAPKVV